MRAQAFQDQLRIAGLGLSCFRATKINQGTREGHFRIYDLRSTYGMRLSAGGVADEWVTQMLRPGDAKVFKKYPWMKLQMKREVIEKISQGAVKESFDTF